MTTQRLVFRLLALAPLLFSGLGARHDYSESVTAPHGRHVRPAVGHTPSQNLLFQDDFEDGDFTTADGAGGLAWELIAGDASVDSVGGSLQLGVDRGYALVATTQRIASDEYTLRFTGRITWSAPGRIVVLFKDADNYYSVGLGEQPGIYRRLNGVEVQLHADPESLIRLPHGRDGAYDVAPRSWRHFQRVRY